jgi:hypothetical protein
MLRGTVDKSAKTIAFSDRDTAFSAWSILTKAVDALAKLALSIP